MREKFRQFMIGRYGTDGLNQFLSIASIVLLLISLLTRFSLFTWLGLVLLVLCYYRSLSHNISKRTEENYQYYALKDRVDRKFPRSEGCRGPTASLSTTTTAAPSAAQKLRVPRAAAARIQICLARAAAPSSSKRAERPCLVMLCPIRPRFRTKHKSATAPPTAGCAAASTHCTACGAALR